MTNKEVRKLFFHFLKKEGMYVKYIHLFKKENEKPVENRCNKRVEEKFIDFYKAYGYNHWILYAFTWESASWSHIHNKWIEYYETNKHNLNNGVDTNG